MKCSNCGETISFRDKDVHDMYSEDLNETFQRPRNTRPKAFLTFGATPRDAKPLREALGGIECVTDVTGMSYADILREHRQLEVKGFAPTLYVRDRTIRTMQLSEATIQRATTLGLVRQGLARDIVEVVYRNDADAVTGVRAHATKLLEDVKQRVTTSPKEPTEVDRLKLQQKQQDLAFKQRQADELLHAKERELQKKGREDQQKIIDGSRSRDITR